MSITIQDISEICGLSIATVSRALNNSPNVRPKTRERVLRVARENGYRPFRHSRLLRQEEEVSLAVFLTNNLMASALQNPFCSLALSAVVDEMERRHGAVTLCSSAALKELHTMPLSMSVLRNVQGVLVLFRDLSDTEWDGLRKTGLPLVMVGDVPPIEDASYIDFNLDRGVALAVDHLADLGHTSIGYWGWAIDDSVSAFRGSLNRRGLSVDEDWIVTPRRRYGPGDWDEMFDWGLLRARDLPSAIFCHNDLVAEQLIQRAGKLGLKVPEDLSVVGFDDLPLAAALDPPLTTVRQPVYALALQGVRGLMAMLDGTCSRVQETLRPEFVVRCSTAAPSNR